MTKKVKYKALVLEEGQEIDPNTGELQWMEADFSYCQSLYVLGIMEYRGIRDIGGEYYCLYYLPLPPQLYEVGV